MRLIPKTPPGSAKRRARAFAGEIVRLREEGYTIEAIKETLADAGLEVSWSTVQREAARGKEKPVQSAERAPATVEAKAPPVVEPGRQQTSNVAKEVIGRKSGKEVAEQFAGSRISNSLMRRRMQNEGSSN